ncbi:MAG: ECF transporter S component [Mucilaginibacter sp.]
MEKDKLIKFVSSALIVFALTYFIQQPLASLGYFNVGDIGVVFAGLFLGWKEGFLAAAIGSAIADAASGYAFFVPLTILAKGMEGFFYGLASTKDGALKYVFSAIGALLMVGIYFCGETYFYPKVGYTGALAELRPNLIQAIGGFIGGNILFLINKSLKALMEKTVGDAAE